MNGKWELVAAWDRLRNDVVFFDTSGMEGFARTGDKGCNDVGIPACMDDCDAEWGAWKRGVNLEQWDEGRTYIPSNV